MNAIMPDKKHLRTYDRADFLALMTQVAYAISPCHFMNKNNPLIIAIYGSVGSGKSLAAEALLKSWMDDVSHTDVVTIPPDNKMFMEKHPMHAIHTVSQVGIVNGSPLTLSFNSDHLAKKQEITDTLSDIFAQSDLPDILILSNAYRKQYYDVPDSPVCLEIDMASPLIGKDPFHREITLTLFKPRLLDDPQFNAYWQRVEDHFKYDQERERALLQQKMKVPPLPGQLTYNG